MKEIDWKFEVVLLLKRLWHLVQMLVAGTITLVWFMSVTLVEWFQAGKQVHEANWPKGT